ncbi:MAG: SAF domain-containing protein [Propionibacteriaceae bacterium]|jgi:hypothetical protein|nr:SAF domain-containing protein [Propionibacteriaceae bacterium]
MPHAPNLPGPQLRRSPKLVAIGAALVVLGALANIYLWTLQGGQEVLIARVDMPRGHVIAAEEIQVAKLSLDPALRVIPSEKLDEIVGQRASKDLSAGVPISPDAVGGVRAPDAGNSLVTVAIQHLPLEPLLPGDQVRMVLADGGDPMAAAVVACPSSEPNTCDVQVPSPDAHRLAQSLNLGAVHLIVEPEG